ncbi:MAG: PEP-CTERM sorting domain-containing protein, partial [Planctomycetota bacterium]|jgi:hypothetical protein
VFTTDNGNGYSWDLHVKGEFKTGGGSTVGGIGAFAGFYANDSTVDIDGDATFDKQAYVVGGTSTWQFGGNVSFTTAFVTAKAFDNVLEQGYGTDVSGARFVIDGADAQNVDLAGEMLLGNLVIDKSSNTATLTDNVLLAGDLDVLAGGFDTNGQVITFNGPDHRLNDEVGIVFDTIALLDNSVVVLASDINVSSLLMGLNSELHILGNELTVGGDVYSGPGTWRHGDGSIIGIPEPATLLLLGSGICGGLAFVRRRWGR